MILFMHDNRFQTGLPIRGSHNCSRHACFHSRIPRLLQACVLFKSIPLGGSPLPYCIDHQPLPLNTVKAWQLDNGTWMGFFGSHGGTSPGDPNSADHEWQVGMCSAPKLAGPWTRMPWLNPASYIERPEGIENPIVTRTTNRSISHTYIAVYADL
jgi:hypothetical protein